MTDRDDDLRATGEDLIADAEELQRIEQRKLELSADDPEAARLADESEQLVRSMTSKTALQRRLADEPPSD
ncbi:MAG TPA: hypothetical protein VMP67_08740 [Candidatus Limnocylindria bacterium]|nr:hypothetical protein [Candidatus Limnocylindria bacterium]